MKKRMLSIALVLCMVLALVPAALAADVTADYSWYNTGDTAFTITDAADLVGFANIVNGTDGQTADTFEGKAVKLGANISLTEEWTPINGFKGEFDGQGHTISHIWNNNAIKKKGFFTSISYAYIHDLTLDDVNFSCTEAVSGAYIGSLACGGNTFSVVENVTVSNVVIQYDNISDSDIGALCGEAYGYSQMRNVTLNNIKIDVKNSTDTYNYIGGVMTKLFGATNPNNDTYGTGGSNRNDAQKHWFEGVENPNGGPLQGYFNNVDINGLDIDTTGNVMVGGFTVYDSQNLGWVGCFIDCDITGLDINVADSGSRATIGGFYANCQTGEGHEEVDLGYDTFTNCHVSGKIVSGSKQENCRIGGFLGVRRGIVQTARNCTTDVTIEAAAGYVGGFIGVGEKVNPGRVFNAINCHAYGTVTSAGASEAGTIGGFIGTIDSGNADDTFVIYDNCTASVEPFVGGGESTQSKVETVPTWYGDGTANEFYISNLEELKQFRDLVNSGVSFAGGALNQDGRINGKHIYLTDDIDLKGEEWTPIGLSKDTAFGGHFYGQGHTISNLVVTQQTDYAGLFGYVRNYGNMYGASDSIINYLAGIEDLTLHNVTIENATNAGAFAGILDQPAGNNWYGGVLQLHNLTLTGHVVIKGTNAGGMFGGSWTQARINTTDLTVDVSEGSFVCGSDIAGGVFASSPHTDLASNIASNIDVNGSNIVGGIAGRAGWKWENVSSTGDVTLNSAAASETGYNVGTAFGMIIDNTYWGSDSRIDMTVLSGTGTLVVNVDGSSQNTNGHHSNLIGGDWTGDNRPSTEFVYTGIRVEAKKKMGVPELAITSSQNNLPGGGTVTLSVAGVPKGGSVTVTCDDTTCSPTLNSDGTYSVTLPADTKIYTFIVIFDGNDDYNSAKATCTVAVTTYYDVIFNSDGGTTVETQTVQYNNCASAPTNPTKDGYRFDGWYLGNDKFNFDTLITQSITLTARWTVNQYTITFDTDGGTEIAPITQDFGTAIIAPENPTKAGYTFAGWDTEIPATMPAQNMTITAQWTAIPVVPTYPPVLTQPENGSITVSPKYPISSAKVTITVTPDEGYELDELTVTDRNGKPVDVTDNGDGTYSFKQPYGKVTITATFKPVETEPETDPVKDCPKDETCPAAKFTDVKMDWTHDGIHFCVENDLMNGISDTSFAPDGNTARAMLVTVLYRLEGEPAVGECIFTDVPAGQWYTNAVIWASENKIVEGYAGKFEPTKDITREAFATILYRYAVYKGYDVSKTADISTFVDGAKTSDWAKDAMAWAVGNGLLNGKGANNLDPTGNATRAEMAAILYRFCENVAK